MQFSHTNCNERYIAFVCKRFRIEKLAQKVLAVAFQISAVTLCEFRIVIRTLRLSLNFHFIMGNVFTI